jgi:hypothetical protein
MNSSAQLDAKRQSSTPDAAVLVREAGVPYQRLPNSSDPFVEWISLMNVVQILCPDWPLRVRPMLGSTWKL